MKKLALVVFIYTALCSGCGKVDQSPRQPTTREAQPAPAASAPEPSLAPSPTPTPANKCTEQSYYTDKSICNRLYAVFFTSRFMKALHSKTNSVDSDVIQSEEADQPTPVESETTRSNENTTDDIEDIILPRFSLKEGFSNPRTVSFSSDWDLGDYPLKEQRYPIEPWVYRVSANPEFMRIVTLIAEKFDDIATRRDKLVAGIKEQQDVFKNDEGVRRLTRDRQYLDKLLLSLAETSQDFFENARIHLATQRSTEVQIDALTGLQSFKTSIAAAESRKNKTLEDSIKAIKATVRELEKAKKR